MFLHGKPDAALHRIAHVLKRLLGDLSELAFLLEQNQVACLDCVPSCAAAYLAHFVQERVLPAFLQVISNSQQDVFALALTSTQRRNDLCIAPMIKVLDPISFSLPVDQTVWICFFR